MLTSYGLEGKRFFLVLHLLFLVYFLFAFYSSYYPFIYCIILKLLLANNVLLKTFILTVNLQLNTLLTPRKVLHLEMLLDNANPKRILLLDIFLDCHVALEVIGN